VVGAGIFLLGVDVTAHCFDRLDFVLANAAVDDLLDPDDRIESELAVVGFHDGKGEWPHDIANVDDILAVLLFERDAFPDALLDGRQRI
jgi:hypothetical protein